VIGCIPLNHGQFDPSWRESLRTSPPWTAKLARCLKKASEQNEAPILVVELIGQWKSTKCFSLCSRYWFVSVYYSMSVSRQFRSAWSSYAPSQLDQSALASNLHKLFSERIEIFSDVNFSKVSILTGIIKIGLKVSKHQGHVFYFFISFVIFFWRSNS